MLCGAHVLQCLWRLGLVLSSHQACIKHFHLLIHLIHPERISQAGQRNHIPEREKILIKITVETTLVLKLFSGPFTVITDISSRGESTMHLCIGQMLWYVPVVLANLEAESS